MDASQKDIRLVFVNINPQKSTEDDSISRTITDYCDKSSESDAKTAFETVYGKTEHSSERSSDGSYVRVETTYYVKSVTHQKDGNDNKQEKNPKTGKEEYVYTVVIRKKITKTEEKEQNDLTIDKNVQTLDKIKAADTQNKSAITVRLDYITLNRQIYHPNEAFADLVFNYEPSADFIQSLLEKLVKFERCSKSSSVTKDSTVEETLTGFYIHDIRPLKKPEREFYLRLHIYSVDQQLNQRKYSRAYLAKRLFTDILLEGADTANNEWTKSSCLFDTKPVLLKFPIRTYYDNSNNNSNFYKYLDHLSYSSSGNERIQPYIVQYNESFYEFIARTANRCGEFFFWDDGALRFGRTCDGKTTLGDNKSLDTEIKDTDCLSVFYTSVNKSVFDNNYFTTDDQNHYSLQNQKYEPESLDLNYSKSENAIDTSESNTNYYYDEEINHDVYRTVIKKDKFTSKKEENFANLRRWILAFIFKAFQKTTLSDSIGSLLADTALSVIFAVRKAIGINKRENKRHFDDEKTIPNLSFRDQSSDNTRALYMSRDAAGHVDAAFYKTIRQKEEQLSEKLLVLNLANAKLLRLGQKIKYNSDNYNYTIIQIKDKPAMNAASGSNFAVLDPEAETLFKDMGNAVMQVVAIPLDGSTVYPPIRPEGHIRRAEPQKAFVTDFYDPQNRGRVRIRYPWQTPDGTIVPDDETNEKIVLHGQDYVEASPWIPVLTPSATQDGGIACELEIGDEVLINYEAGNIDRPYVAGSLFNRKNHIPFRRGNMTLVSKNGHGITFNDPVDVSKFVASFFPAWSFFDQFVSSYIDTSKADLKVVGGTTITDAYGFYKMEMSTDQRKIDISSPFGKVAVSAFTGININAPNGDIVFRGQNINIEAGNNIRIVSGLNIKSKSEWDSADKSGKIAQIAGAIVGGLADVLQPTFNLVDLDLLRKIIQTFARPLEGTCEIKSHKYLLLESEKGAATVPNNRYAPLSRYKGEEDHGVYFAAVAHVINTIYDRVDETMKDLHKKQQAVRKAREAYNALFRLTLASGHTIKATTHRGEEIISNIFNTGTGDVQGAPNPQHYDYAYFQLEERNGGVAPDDITTAADSTQKKAVKDIKKLIKAADNLIKAAGKYYDCYKTHHSTTDPKRFGIDKIGSVWPNAIKSKFNDKVKNRIPDFTGDFNIDDFTPANAQDYTNPATIKLMKRKWVKRVFDELQRTDAAHPTSDIPYGGVLDRSDDTSWAASVNAMTEDTGRFDGWEKLGLRLSNTLLKEYHATFKAIRDYDHWRAGQDGQIIITDNTTNSFYFNNSNAQGSWVSYPNNTESDAHGLRSLKQLLHSLD